ncbi:hypothetical protein ACFPZ0_25080 [Streptomonospora nanhaiensis]|uniref:Uncharacterized protein n=1 Tax=Streptomonospora nanhaiensis TaxID=1323731 RepID=A0A853BNY7_9ACTN|nr:hypothetical protein [Streptomonospora nanhaiensis]MBV2363964.1 hypothetical protein [Streptomonospora nanhaiensis]MBX9388429.1 hypothetical protein [Streptomonospora nanhaiensis]NYI96720.1 hypothetical protein [Streptomonospora nanhaiensis]
MKFELVDPAEWPEPAAPKAADGQDGHDTPADAETAAAPPETDPNARLRIATRRLSQQVRHNAAAIRENLAHLMEQVARAELAMTDSGQRPTRAPSSFRPARFGPGGESAGAGGAAERPAAADTAPATPVRGAQPRADGRRPEPDGNPAAAAGA